MVVSVILVSSNYADVCSSVNFLVSLFVIILFAGFPRVMEFLEYHGILKGLFQTLKVREFYIFFVQVMEYQGFLFVNSIQ